MNLEEEVVNPKPAAFATGGSESEEGEKDKEREEEGTE
jgi:hypothetical protein